MDSPLVDLEEIGFPAHCQVLNRAMKSECGECKEPPGSLALECREIRTHRMSGTIAAEHIPAGKLLGFVIQGGRLSGVISPNVKYADCSNASEAASRLVAFLKGFESWNVSSEPLNASNASVELRLPLLAM